MLRRRGGRRPGGGCRWRWPWWPGALAHMPSQGRGLWLNFSCFGKVICPLSLSHALRNARVAAHDSFLLTRRTPLAASPPWPWALQPKGCRASPAAALANNHLGTAAPAPGGSQRCCESLRTGRRECVHLPLGHTTPHPRTPQPRVAAHAAQLPIDDAFFPC
jgi:hypothetical protein